MMTLKRKDFARFTASRKVIVGKRSSGKAIRQWVEKGTVVSVVAWDGLDLIVRLPTKIKARLIRAGQFADRDLLEKVGPLEALAAEAE